MGKNLRGAVMHPEISIVIPTYNGSSRILQCLDAVSGQETSRSFEVIVVDDGSTDSTADLVSDRPDLRLIRQENAGPAAARNKGVQEAFGDIVLFTDDDCVPVPDWLERMVAPFSDTEVAGVKGAYLTKQMGMIARFVQIEYEEKYEQLSRQEQTNLVDTYSAAFRRRTFMDVGGYDESFPTASVEDRDFSYKLSALGHKQVFAPEARVFHTHVDTLWGYLRKKYKNGYWGIITILKYPATLVGPGDTPRTQKIQVLLAAMMGPALLVSLAGGWAVVAPAVVAGAFLLTTVPFTLRCLGRDPGVSWVAPFLLACRAVGLSLGFVSGLMREKLGSALVRKPLSDVGKTGGTKFTD